MSHSSNSTVGCVEGEKLVNLWGVLIFEWFC